MTKENKISKIEETIYSSTSKSTLIKRFNWSKILMKDKFFGKTHPHTREKERRLKQIQSGVLKIQNNKE